MAYAQRVGARRKAPQSALQKGPGSRRSHRRPLRKGPGRLPPFSLSAGSPPSPPPAPLPLGGGRRSFLADQSSHFVAWRFCLGVWIRVRSLLFSFYGDAHELDHGFCFGSFGRGGSSCCCSSMLLWWWYWKKKKKKKNSVRLRFWLWISMSGYNHSQVWLAEFVGTTILVLLGLGGVANGVLPGTKGHGFGILGVALSFALGIFIAQQCVGHISGTYVRCCLFFFFFSVYLFCNPNPSLWILGGHLKKFLFPTNTFSLMPASLSFILFLRVFLLCDGGDETLQTGFFNPAIALAGAVVGNIHWTHFWICFSAEFVGGFFAAIIVWISYFPHFQSLEQVDPTCTCCDLETHGIAIIRQELSAAARRYFLTHLPYIIVTCTCIPSLCR